jgi:hypothetical protein
MGITDSTRGKVHERCREKLVGDSPELYRGLDEHWFSDLGASVALSCYLASLHPVGHPLREKRPMGKVSTLLMAMGEVWKHCAPTGARMLKGALEIGDVLKVVIAARGAVVPGEFYRTGRQ